MWLMNNSLRRQLLVWVLLPLAVAIAVDTWLTHRSSNETAAVVQDRLLLGSARMIAQQISFEDGSFQLQIPPAALELFQSTELDHIYYRVTTGAGKLLSGYSDLAKCAHPPKFGHFVKTSPSEVLWTTVFALGINHLACQRHLSFAVPV